nr:MAG TPA: hypothetical protein [Caudoviricetes sp.]
MGYRFRRFFCVWKIYLAGVGTMQSCSNRAVSIFHISRASWFWIEGFVP